MMTMTTNSNKKKVKKATISKTLKMMIWSTWVDKNMDKGSILCPVCNVIKINMMTFVAGHVIAEVKGGPTIVENLRPICGTCNSSMGSNTMDLSRCNMHNLCFSCKMVINKSTQLFFSTKNHTNDHHQAYCQGCIDKVNQPCSDDVIFKKFCFIC